MDHSLVRQSKLCGPPGTCRTPVKTAPVGPPIPCTPKTSNKSPYPKWCVGYDGDQQQTRAQGMTIVWTDSPEVVPWKLGKGCSRDSITPLMLGVLIISLILLLSGSLAALLHPGESLFEPYGRKVTLYRAHLLADIGATHSQMSPQTKTRSRQLSTYFGVLPLERTCHALSLLGYLSTVDRNRGSFSSNSLPVGRAPPASSLT